MLDFSKREIRVLIFGAGFVVLFCCFRFGIAPVFDKRNDLKRILNDKKNALEEMVLLQHQFFADTSRFDSDKETLAARKKNFSLFTFIDLQAQQTGVKDNVAYMKPFTRDDKKALYTIATVKVKLKEVYLKELVDFLYHIESSKNCVTIISLSLSKAGKEKLKLDALIETQTPMFKDKA